MDRKHGNRQKEQQDHRNRKRTGTSTRARTFGLLYGIALAACTAYVLLDTFVIPRGVTTVSAVAAATANSTATLAAAETASTSTDSNEDASTTGNTGAGSNTDSADRINVSDNSSDSDDAGHTITEDSTDSTVADSSESGTSTDSVTRDNSESGTDTTTFPVVTDTSYQDDNISISYSTERVHDTTCYIVDIQVSDVSYLQAALAQNTYGRNIKETTSDMAAEHNAILAINGDYYGFRDYGYVIRNGVLYRSTGGNDEDLVIDADGSMRIIKEEEVSASELQAEGAWQVLSFGPALVNDSEIVVGENQEVDQAMTSNPRTAIGMISPLHYIIVVSDGRTSESEGLTLYELAQIFQEKGASVAYNLDGGGSSTLYFNGKVINKPSGGMHSSGERKVSDILYI